MRQIFTSAICFFGLAMLFSSCKDDRNPYPIPNYSVNILIYLDSFDSDLVIGRVKTFSREHHGAAGYLGVVVYRHSLDEFFAYDMACPNDWSNWCTVIEHASRATEMPADLCLECASCCKTKFSLLDGYPQSTTYKYPLRQYSVSKESDSRFRVHN